MPTGEQPSMRFDTIVDPEASRTVTVIGLNPFRVQMFTTLLAIKSACSRPRTGTYSKPVAGDEVGVAAEEKESTSPDDDISSR